jgi:glycerate dehydrogenase
MRIAVLDSFTADQGEDRWQALRDALGDVGDVRLFPRTTPTDIVERARGCQIILTNKVVIDAAVIAALASDGLRYIGVMATGTNVVDLAAAKAHGVVVTNVPGYSTASVAQLVMALVLHLTTNVAEHSAQAKAGAWANGPDFCFFTQPLTELAGKTLVIVGMGAIGNALSRIATAFGMRVIAAAVPGSPTPNRMALNEALPQADIVSLHCPLTPATNVLVNAAFLQQLKPGTLLINTGRGPLLDEIAVVQALASGRLGGLGIDVLSKEPPAANHPFLDRSQPWANRVVVTPHIAWGTVEARARLISEVTANIVAFRDGQLRNRVG